MTTHLELTLKQSNFITTLSRFPASKMGPSLLSIIESPMHGVIIVDATRQIVLVNQRIENLFGYPAKYLLEKPLDVLLPSHAGTEQQRKMQRLTATRISGKRAKIEFEGVHANGAQFPLQATIARITVHGELFLALIMNEHPIPQPLIGKKRPTRSADLRKWAVCSQQANEIEKRRFSKKLYDDIGQRLSVLKLDLDWLENSLPDMDECVPARVAQMQCLLGNVITMTKSMASALRPPLLDDFGLMPAVKWMAENFQKKTAVRCIVESNTPALKLHDPIESAVFRVIQESLENIERHAHASNAKIVFTHRRNQLDVMIQDDGIGLENGSEHKTGCYGLMAMQERIFVLGGTISIKNIKPQGVQIHASIPIDVSFNSEPHSHPSKKYL